MTYNETNTYVPICPQCTETVSSYGHPCMSILREACSHYLLSESLNYSENYASAIYQIRTTIKFMERKGYLLTTEIDDHRLGIFPNTRLGGWDHINQRFCWCK